jgi:lysophospholipase L1-like esterase
MQKLLALVIVLVSCVGSLRAEEADAAKPAARTGKVSKNFNPALPTLWLIGDSTVKNGRGTGGDGLFGWGTPIPEYFDKTKINVENHALGGTSSRSYRTLGSWEPVLKLIRPGDFLIMQFGHNDGGSPQKPIGSIKGIGEESKEGPGPNNTTETVYSYGWYLRKYVADVREKGATPIVCSLIPRNDWKEGKIQRASESGYGLWAKQVAEQTETPFIDLNSLICDRYEKLGEYVVKSFFPKEHTHTGWDGAVLNADCVVNGIQALSDCKLKEFLLPTLPTNLRHEELVPHADELLK